MLSYLHGYHAGNFADVHKHCTLMLLLKKLHAKNTPITYIDTHAGAGLYALDDEKAEKTRESQLGVDALLASKTGVTHSAITEYLHLLASVRVSKQHTLGEHAYYRLASHCTSFIARAGFRHSYGVAQQRSGQAEATF